VNTPVQNCPECGAPLANDTSRCSQCGWSDPVAYRRASTRAYLFLMILMLVLGVGVLLLTRHLMQGIPSVP